jgi:hypothetical protein
MSGEQQETYTGLKAKDHVFRNAYHVFDQSALDDLI